MPQTSMVHVRVDENVKLKAAETLATMGLSISDAVRVLLVRVAAERRLPFELKVPNAVTRKAMTEAEEIVTSRSARFGSAAEMFDALEDETCGR